MIRKATLQDLDQLTDMFDKYVVFYKKPSNIQKHKAFLKERIENNEATIYIAFDENNPEKAVGFVLNYVAFSSFEVNKIIILNDIYVDSNARKQGVGEKLIQQTIAQSKEIGASLIRLRTARNNAVAHGLYHKMGFKMEDFVYSFELKTK